MKKDIQKQFNKYYSTSSELLKFIDIDYYKNFDIVEPFYGNGDLVKDFENIREKYDISPDNDTITKRDTLKNPPNYENKIVITNPPYTAKNHMPKELKELYADELKDVQDLYQIHIKHLIKNPCLGGIEVLPINFMFGDATKKLRKQFLDVYYLKLVNIYEYKIFKDTSQNVITLEFINKTISSEEPKTVYNLFKSSDEILEDIKPVDMFKGVKQSQNVCRFYNISEDFKPTNMIVKLLDYNMEAEYSETIKEDKLTDRAKMTICFKVGHEPTDINETIKLFNDKLKEIREKSYSLNLSSYREFERKRLSFEQVKQIFTMIGN